MDADSTADRKKSNIRLARDTKGRTRTCSSTKVLSAAFGIQKGEEGGGLGPMCFGDPRYCEVN